MLEPRLEDGVNFYGYTPSRTFTLLFVVLFLLSSLTHAFQAARYKTWWALPTMVLCGLMELIGWGARFSSSFDPTLSNPFIIQAVATLVGPTPLIAGDFIILATLIRILGPKYSRLSPRLYMWFPAFSIYGTRLI